MDESIKCCGSCRQFELADNSGRGLCFFAGIVWSEDVCDRWEQSEQQAVSATA